MSVPTGQNPSFVLHKPLHVTYEDRPIPSLTHPNDVLVQVKVTGICGSDVHYWQHGRIGSFILEKPMVLGHESAGIVSKVGEAVKHLKVGDKVALEPGVPCRRCDKCKAGKYNLCKDMAFAATPPYDGTLAKFYVLPEDYCIKLPDHVSLEEGALMEPLSVGVHVVRQASVIPGQTVVVFGAGPVGLLCCAVAKAYGATKVIAVDIVPSRLEFAKKYAATGSYQSSRDLSAKENAMELLKQNGLPLDGVDVAIDASGATPSIQAAIYVLKSGGTFVQAGMGAPEISFPITEMCCKEINMKGSFRYGPGDYQQAGQLLADGRVSVKELITGRVTFGEAEKAFEEVKAGKGIKILIAGPE